MREGWLCRARRKWVCGGLRFVSVSGAEAGDGGQRKRVARSNLPAAPTMRPIAAVAWGRIASGVGKGISDDGRVRLRVHSEAERLRVRVGKAKKKQGNIQASVRAVSLTGWRTWHGQHCLSVTISFACLDQTNVTITSNGIRILSIAKLSLKKIEVQEITTGRVYCNLKSRNTSACSTYTAFARLSTKSLEVWPPN